MGLNRDNNLFSQVFGMEPVNSIQLPQHLTITKVTDALIAAAQDCFTMQVEVKSLSPEEWEEILRSEG